MPNMSLMSRNERNGGNGESSKGGGKLNENAKGAPCKVANLTISAWQKSNLIKICHGFVEYSNWIPIAAPWRVATLTKNEESSNWRK